MFELELVPMPCRRCGYSRWIPVVYGEASPELAAAVESRHVVHGGTVVPVGGPGRACKTCLLIDGADRDWDGVYGPRTDEYWYAPLSSRLTAAAAAARDIPAWDALALSFDGYAAFGDKGAQRINATMLRRWKKTGRLSDNLAVLRCALFIEQRHAHWAGSDMWREPEFVEAVIAKLDACAADLGEPT